VVKVVDLERYIEKVEKERDITIKGVFWSEFIAGILALRKKASKNLETYEDPKLEQGKIQAYDKVLGLPDRLIDFVREEKRATNR
jgi:hypothetical protein